MFDPFYIYKSFSDVCTAWMRRPDELSAMLSELGDIIREISAEWSDFGEFSRIGQTSLSLTTDHRQLTDNVIRTYAKTAQKYHKRYSGWLKNLTEKAPGLDESERKRALFWIQQMISGMAPSNFFWTNPAAVQRFINTNGESLQRGFQQWLEDFSRGDNLLRLSDEKAFEIGKNIATTKGAVIFRNELMELIQYAPVTEKTYAAPVVFIQPWINKYYIFDLSENNSFVRYLISQGFTVFITSWKNPTAGMRHITFEDYMLNGVLKAIDIASHICQSPQVHVAGYCIGGTVLAALMAWLNAGSGEIPVADWSVFATLTDFSTPGDIGVFIGEHQIAVVEQLMKVDGYLDSKYLALTFRLLNPDALIWRYVVNNYLYGESPPKSDMLFWNSDSTRLPEAMCSFFLRECYLKNKLIQKNGVTLGGRPIDIGAIVQPLYAVGAIQDHISPWQATFATAGFVNGPVKYVLSSEGHITGIVNPPSARSKKKYWAGNISGNITPETWLAAQTEQRGSWWEDWVKWLIERSGRQQTPPSMGCGSFPVIENTPGRYVFE